jgi:hypothetical protein
MSYLEDMKHILNTHNKIKKSNIEEDAKDDNQQSILIHKHANKTTKKLSLSYNKSEINKDNDDIIENEYDKKDYNDNNKIKKDDN